MKQTTCRNLNGCCDAVIMGASPAEIGENCKLHVMQMIGSGDTEHKTAVEAWMHVPKEEQEAWFGKFIDNFNDLPDVEV